MSGSLPHRGRLVWFPSPVRLASVGRGPLGFGDGEMGFFQKRGLYVTTGVDLGYILHFTSHSK